MSTLVGWTQSSPKWTVWKSNSDTIITYNYTKTDLTNVRLYITGLEETRELYNIEVQQSQVKDSIIAEKNKKLNNYSNIVIEKDSIIGYTVTQFTKADKWGKAQEVQKIKYKKQAARTPWLMGISSAIGFILSILIMK